MTIAVNSCTGSDCTLTTGTWSLDYMLTDYLGSVVAVTDANGTLISQQRYLPFGGVRTDTNPPFITQTDLGYTGQRNNSYIELMDFKARWLDPDLGRFTQPDSIVPNPANPQSFNRYGYANNSPINFSDPSGHKPCWATKVYSCNLTQDQINSLLHGSKSEQNFINNLLSGSKSSDYKKLNWFLKFIGYGQQGCTQTYKECFDSYSLLSLQDGQQLDQDQFGDLVHAVYYDLSQHHPSKYNPFDWLVRWHYDTPFWNGTYSYRDPNDPDTITIRPGPDTTVCLGTICDKRSDINYFAQGMWDAAMHRTAEESIALAEDYKNHFHGTELSDRAAYWIQFGYDAYQALEAQGTP